MVRVGRMTVNSARKASKLPIKRNHVKRKGPPASLRFTFYDLPITFATMSEHREIGVTLLGCGIVGGGVVNVLTRQREMIRQRTGIDFVLRHVVVKSVEEY